jgi:hypothetical protein
MNLRQWWGGRREAPPRRDAAAAWVDAVCAEPDAPQEPAGGCGWFDSSHELHAGLQVTEHLSPEQRGQRSAAGLVAGLARRGAGQRRLERAVPLSSALRPAGRPGSPPPPGRSRCLVFITNGPYCAIGSPSGRPAIRIARAPCGPACSRTPSLPGALARIAMRWRRHRLPPMSSAPR